MLALKDIRNRIHSVTNIRQITKAMEMVAAARLHRAQQRAERAQHYIENISDLLDDVSSNDHNNPLFTKREVKRRGIIVISGDKGLCGAYHTNLFAEVDRLVVGADELFLIGHKGVEHYQQRRAPIAYAFSKWAEGDLADLAKSWSSQLVHLFLSEYWDEVTLVYTKYINMLVREVKIEKYLPLEVKARKPKDFIFEPDAVEVMRRLAPPYCMTKLEMALSSAYAAELSARVVAMRSAAKNADEMIDDLTLMRNKVRQASITKEITEIATGAGTYE